MLGVLVLGDQVEHGLLGRAVDGRQVGWYRPADANVFAPYWHKGFVFVADFTRGVEILKFNGSKRSRTVKAPAVAPTESLKFDRGYLGGLCPLPV